MKLLERRCCKPRHGFFFLNKCSDLIKEAFLDHISLPKYTVHVDQWRKLFFNLFISQFFSSLYTTDFVANLWPLTLLPSQQALLLHPTLQNRLRAAKQFSATLLLLWLPTQFQLQILSGFITHFQRSFTENCQGHCGVPLW